MPFPMMAMTMGIVSGDIARVPCAAPGAGEARLNSLFRFPAMKPNIPTGSQGTSPAMFSYSLHYSEGVHDRKVAMEVAGAGQQPEFWCITN